MRDHVKVKALGAKYIKTVFALKCTKFHTEPLQKYSSLAETSKHHFLLSATVAKCSQHQPEDTNQISMHSAGCEPVLAEVQGLSLFNAKLLICCLQTVESC